MKENKMFISDLQLFADGESTAEPTVSEASTEGVNNVTEPTTTENVSQNTTEVDSHDIRLGTDGKGNKTLILEGDPFGLSKARDEPNEAEQTEIEQEAEPEQQGEQEHAQMDEPQQPTYYNSMDELVQAQAMGLFEESKVSPDQRQILMNLAMQQQLQQQRATQLQQQQTQREAETQRAFKQMADEAKAEAFKLAGLNPDDLNNTEYMEGGEDKKKIFEEKYAEIATSKMKQYLANQIMAEQRANQHMACMREVQSFAMMEQQHEPHFAEITAMMDADKMNMPYYQAQKLIQAEYNFNNGCCTPNDLQAMREFYDTCKKKVYQNHAGVTKVPQRTAPPKVENASQPTEEKKAPEIDFEKVRSLPAHQRSQVMTDIIASMM